MRTLKFVITGQTVTRDPSCDFSGLVAGSVGYLWAEFRMDSAWSGCKVAASFWRGRKEYAVPLINGGCLIPDEVLVGSEFSISLTGERKGYKIKTNRVDLHQEVS